MNNLVDYTPCKCTCSQTDCSIIERLLSLLFKGVSTLWSDRYIYTMLATMIARGLHSFTIRKELKPYGKSSIIEGNLPSGSRLLLIDDVTGAGSSASRCCEILHELGIEVVGYSSIVDR
ncbi:hypothetical protein [Paenibacillus sp. P46E]|uniref:hypothetical protein n=1 Tax=Paenibacillus sp. P46E TaxID=1349436 RepID=UPI000A5B4DB8|nr:hypothetical protein [Paenibacillus sp. P46E]